MDAGSITPPNSRNSPCPCGSGLRYKSCHGALAEGQGAAPAGLSAPRVSSYRAPAREWPDVSEVEQDRLGAIMERALSHQLAARSEEAARDYRTVLEHAPDTHDALHMLGVIELGRDKLDEAERLIRRATTLRDPYPAIVRNLKLVEEARLVHRRESPELLCERALPIFADLALVAAGKGARGADMHRLRARGSRDIHLIGRVHAPMHDDGWLFRRLSSMLDASLWATDAEGVGDIDGRPWRGLDATIGAYPRTGTHIVVGVDTENLAWLDHVESARVIVFCGGVAPSVSLDQLRHIARDGARPLELVFFSSAHAARFGAGHRVVTPPVEITTTGRAPSAPAPPARGVWRVEERARFRIGMVGQCCHAVLDDDAGEALQSLRQCADELAIYDPGRLRFVFGDVRNVKFVPRTQGGVQSFLSGLDALVLRPRIWYYEGGMHEFFAARALGLPVLCPKASHWAEYIEDRVDGLCYASHSQLLQLLGDLRTAPGWAAELGSAARTRALTTLDPGRLGREYAELVRGDSFAGMPGGQLARVHIA